jgi:signal transduction histidine kinase
MSRLRIAAWVAAALPVAFVATEVGRRTAGGEPDWIPLWFLPLLVTALLAPVVVGLLIANRQPRNVIAWIMLLGPLPLTMQAPVWLLFGRGWMLQIDRAIWPLLYAWPIAIAFVFPNGHFLSRRWKWVAAFGAVAFGGFMTLALLDPAPFEGEDARVRNPLAGNAVGEALTPDVALWVFLLGMLGTLLVGAYGIRLRLRRSTGVERLQTLWLAWALGLVPIVLALCMLSGLVGFALGVTFVDWVVFPLLLGIWIATAAAIGLAITRHGLYEIERLVNRTLVYAALTALLVSAYAGMTIGLGVLVGGDSPWVIAVATLMVAIAFRPLRARIQDLVDRRYRRARYEGVRLVRSFEDQVRDGVRPPEEIGQVVAEALSDSRAELFFWLPETGAFADAGGEIVARLPRDDRAEREIRRDDARTAVLLHDPALRERRDLLDGVLGAAALSIEMARLRVEVRLQLAEVEASRARIVEAGYEERRRLERDLHDGAQQRLVSLGVQLRRLQLGLPKGAEVLSPAIDQAVDEVGATIGDLRQIAAGVRPARLDDGLAAALRDLARSAPVRVDVEAPRERVPASVEAAAYFIACEALTNAVKHGSPTKVAVRAYRDNGALRVSVSDDGVGGAVVRRGSGLAGLRDRVAAHGGTFALESPRGGGTRLEVAIPCES